MAILITIIIIAILIVGIKYFLEPWGLLLTIISASLLLLHLPCWLTVNLGYQVFKEEGRTIQETLINSRENSIDNESILIMSDVVDWNKNLNKYKLLNKHPILGIYIHDDIETLEEIK